MGERRASRAFVGARVVSLKLPMLRLVLPKGSLEAATFELFDAADLTVKRSSQVDYRASIDDPRIDEVRILRPQEIPTYVAEGLFDIGITGRDWIEETESKVESLGRLNYSKATNDPVRIVVAVANDAPYQKVGDLPKGVRVTSEYPRLTKKFFQERGIEAMCAFRTAQAKPRSPTLLTAWSTSPKLVGRCALRGCESSTRFSRATPNSSQTRRHSKTQRSATRWSSCSRCSRVHWKRAARCS